MKILVSFSAIIIIDIDIDCKHKSRKYVDI